MVPASPRSQAGSPASGTAFAALLIAVGLTAAIHLVPEPWGSRVGWPLLLLSTYAHEMCHGLAALAVGGQFSRFVMFADASGMATTATRGPVAGALVCAGGLVGPALFAGLLFALGRWPRASRPALAGLGALLLLSDALVVRNPFGLAYVGAVGTLLLVLARALPRPAAQGALVFLAVQLSLAVFSRADYLFTRVAHTGAGEVPSDVEVIARNLFPPYWLWGLACGAFSVAVLALGLWLMLRDRAAR